MTKPTPIERKCSICIYWHKIPNNECGQCRIDPPRADRDGDSYFPYTGTDCWCGGFERIGNGK